MLRGPTERQDQMDNRSRNYIGDLGAGMNPALARRLRNSDCLLVLGARLGDTMTGGYELFDPAAPGKSILHVHPDPDLPGSVHRTVLCVTARAPAMVARLVRSPKVANWTVWVESGREEYEAWSQPRETPGSVKLEEVVRWLSDTLPEDAIITNGADNYAAFVQRYFGLQEIWHTTGHDIGSDGCGISRSGGGSPAAP